MKVTKGNRIIYDGTDKTLKHGSYNPKLKRYYNSSTGKWVSYPVKIVKSKFFMYEFECFDYDTCKLLFKEQNINVERVLKFIDRGLVHPNFSNSSHTPSLSISDKQLPLQS